MPAHDLRFTKRLPGLPPLPSPALSDSGNGAAAPTVPQEKLR
jgi:hypothetical protein